MADDLRISLLDVGPEEYGDALFAAGSGLTIAIDGGHPADIDQQGDHPAIPAQLGELRAAPEPLAVDLLVVTHGHLDHIGCLPALVAADRLRAKWVLAIDPALAWGRRAGVPAPDAGMDARIRTVVAALREEPRYRATDASLDVFLADAAGLEDRYTGMLNTLEGAGSTVVRLGRSSVDDVAQLLEAFAPLGLKLLGPSEVQLFQCAELIAEGLADAVDWVAERVNADATVDGAALYRTLTASLAAADAPGGGQRPGAAINLQSIVLALGPPGARALLTGDMQLAKPEVTDPVVRAEVKALRERIRTSGPYGMVKIAHHGSPNAFSAAVMADTPAVPFYGISAGAGSVRHPAKSVLDALGADPAVKWARSDRNGLSTFHLAAGAPGSVEPDHGALNDSTVGVIDAGAPPQGAIATGEGALGSTPGASAQASGSELTAGPVEIITRIPEASLRVQLVIEVERTGASTSPPAQPARPAAVPDSNVGRLLFVTRRRVLGANVGVQEAADALRGLEERGARIFDAPEELADGPAVAAVVGKAARSANADGVVLIGGYDVLPSIRLDTLPATVRGHVAASGDPDGFVVWNDEAYADLDGDGLAELPVSRIPDGRSAALLQAQLARTTPPPRQARAGIRNVKRPFAGPIFEELPGSGRMLVSEPQTYKLGPPGGLPADRAYFMLHGDYVDGSRFWGEETPEDLEAFNADGVPDSAGTVVLAGCCWGALITGTPASRYAAGRPVAPRPPEASVALTYLARGALAFVGCTGAHYSPSVEPYDYFGGPMHKAFWTRSLAGIPPARALFEAKSEYFAGMPHGQTGWSGQAIEYKVWRQFTCLGPGWPLA
jgi:Metallo-beta-lactamase superfamily